MILHGCLRIAGPCTRLWPVCSVPSLGEGSAQNQRSIFGFLNSCEPAGFQEFLRRAEDPELYPPHLLWEYLRLNLEPSIMASPDGHRWALAVEAIERCQALGRRGYAPSPLGDHSAS